MKCLFFIIHVHQNIHMDKTIIYTSKDNEF